MKEILQSKYHLLFGLLLFSCFSCSSNMHKETAFERVAAYYKTSGDSLKFQAAQYLLQFAQYHYGIKRSLPHGLDAVRFLDCGDSVFKHFLDSCNYTVKCGLPVLDTRAVSEDYLRKNIELAFDSWKKPWAEAIPFKEFCKYILPYRNGDEELSNWRQYFKQKYEHTIIDSVENITSLEDVASYLIRCLRREVAYGGSTGAWCHDLLTPHNIERLHWISCENCAHYASLALRACGIPCSFIEIHWRFTEIPHASVLVPAVGNNQKAFRITLGDTLMYMGAPKDTMAAWRVWRYAYEANPTLKRLLEDNKTHDGYKETIQNFALPVTREDVTSLFSKTFDFSMPIPDSLRENETFFLCRFYQWKWHPVREGVVIRDSVYFKDATIRQWYRMGYLDNQQIHTFGTPFTIIGQTDIKNKKERIRLFDLTGDTVLFRMCYPCKKNETRLTRYITTYYWDSSNQWKPYRGEAILWGYNKAIDQYKPFDESLRDSYRPEHYRLEVRLPCWTVFTDDETARALGFLRRDSILNIANFIEF